MQSIFDRTLYRFKSRLGYGRRDKPYHFHSRRNNARFTRVNPERHNSFQPAFMVCVKNKSARVRGFGDSVVFAPPQEGNFFFSFFKTGSRFILLDDPCKDKIVSRNRRCVRQFGRLKKIETCIGAINLSNLSEKDNLLGS